MLNVAKGTAEWPWWLRRCKNTVVWQYVVSLRKISAWKCCVHLRCHRTRMRWVNVDLNRSNDWPMATRMRMMTMRKVRRMRDERSQCTNYYCHWDWRHQRVIRRQRCSWFPLYSSWLELKINLNDGCCDLSQKHQLKEMYFRYLWH